jgi:predicted acetyltransferase
MITLQHVEYEHKSTLRQLLELYKYDFSEYIPDDVNESGLYEYKYLDHYWTEEGRHSFFIRVDGRLAGFVLVRRIGMDELDRPLYSVAEFFVMKKYRKLGVGTAAATEVFDRFPGVWRVAQVEANKPSKLFWKKVIATYTNGHFQEIREDKWDGPIHIFSNDV